MYLMEITLLILPFNIVEYSRMLSNVLRCDVYSDICDSSIFIIIMQQVVCTGHIIMRTHCYFRVTLSYIVQVCPL